MLAPLEWGRSVYTVVVLPEALVARARAEGTHRLEGSVDDVALAATPSAEAAFAARTPPQRRQLLVPVEGAATAPTRARRIQELVRSLT